MKAIVYSGMLVFATCGITEGAMAQIIADTTVGTQVTQSGAVFNINNGTRSGDNLFHSFSQFSIPTNGSAIFNNATNVQNIFSRVTGSQLSSIDGILKTQGTANLFLMNPNGIVFGPNAKLDLGGSFIGTTANSIKFEDGIEFSTTNLTANPLLTVKVPVGLQVGQNPGAITHRSPTGFQVTPGKDLLLVGGEIRLEKGQLVAPSGNVELAAVRSSGAIELIQNGDSLQLKLSPTLPRANIVLSNEAGVDTRAGKGGRIALYAQNLTITQESGLRAGVSRIGQLGVTSSDVIVDVLDHVYLDQTSRIDNRVAANGLSNSGNINLTATSIDLDTASRISTTTQGIGNSGNINITLSGDLVVRGFGRDGNSRINATSDGLALGNAGNITIQARSVLMSEGGAISTNTSYAGRGGNITIRATERVVLAGIDPNGDSTRLSNQSGLRASGNAGDMTILTNELILREGGMLRSQAGNGNGGNIRVDAKTIQLLNGGQISTSTRGTGQAGVIDLRVREQLTISGSYPSPFPNQVVPDDLVSLQAQFFSGIYASTTTTAIGGSGNVRVQASQFNLSDGAQINVSSLGQGKTGNLRIQADRATLNRGALLAEITNGDQGNIQIDSNLLLLRDGSQITTSAKNNSNGGNITLNSPLIVGLENSDVIANALGGRGGRININTQSLVGLEFRNMLTPRQNITNDITASSQFSVNGTVQINTIGINPTNSLNTLPVDVVDSSRQISDRCAAAKTSSFISTGRGGIPNSPTKTRQSDRTWNDLRDTRTDRAVTTNVSNPIITPIAQAPIIEASALRTHPDGAIELIAPIPSSIDSGATCAI